MDWDAAEGEGDEQDQGEGEDWWHQEEGEEEDAEMEDGGDSAGNTRLIDPNLVQPACQRLAERCAKKYGLSEMSTWRLAEILAHRRQQGTASDQAKDMRQISKHLERASDPSALLMATGEDWLEGPIGEPEFSAMLGSYLRRVISEKFGKFSNSDGPWGRTARGRGGRSSAAKGRGKGKGRGSSVRDRLGKKSSKPLQPTDPPPPWRVSGAAQE